MAIDKLSRIKFLKNNPNDIEVIDEAVDIILGSVDFDINKVGKVEKNIVAVAAAQSTIDDGGLSFFFEKDFDGFFPHQYFIKCYDAIGAYECAKALEDVLKLFPGGTPQLNREVRLAFLDVLVKGHDEASDIFFKCERLILGNRRVLDMLADYIRRKF